MVKVIRKFYVNFSSFTIYFSVKVRYVIVTFAPLCASNEHILLRARYLGSDVLVQKGNPYAPRMSAISEYMCRTIYDRVPI